MASLVLLLGHGGAARRASEPERSGVRSPVRCVELFCLWPSGVRGVVAPGSWVAHTPCGVASLASGSAPA